MISEELRAALVALPVKQIGPVLVVAFTHENRDLFRTLLMIVDLWSMVREDVSEVKALDGLRGICGVYSNTESYLPMQIMCVLAAEFNNHKMVAAEGVILVTDTCDLEASTILRTLANLAVNHFCARVQAKYRGTEFKTHFKR